MTLSRFNRGYLIIQRLFFVYICLSVLVLIQSSSLQAQDFASKDYKLSVAQVFSGLKNPWSFLWLDSQHILVSERNGVFKIINIPRKSVVNAYRPKFDKYMISQSGQGGLLDLLQDPDDKSLVYATARYT